MDEALLKLRRQVFILALHVVNRVGEISPPAQKMLFNAYRQNPGHDPEETDYSMIAANVVADATFKQGFFE